MKGNALLGVPGADVSPNELPQLVVSPKQADLRLTSVPPEAKAFVKAPRQYLNTPPPQLYLTFSFSSNPLPLTTMADPKEPNKCAKCSKPITMHSPSLCTFCEVAQYCSAQRRTDDL